MTNTRTDRTVVLTRPAQLKALGHPVRTAILAILEDEPHSAKRLAERLGMTHGKVGHHLHILEREGLIEVAEERQVRGFVEKVLAPTYDRLEIRVPGREHDRLAFMLQQAAREAAPADTQPMEPLGRIYSVRMPQERAGEFARRLVALADEFAAAGDGEGERYGMVGAVYRIDLPGGEQ
jgi:DNA-binding transcriptional ArsR family regulator